MAERVLVIGSGSREQSLALKLAQSGHVKQVLVAPGNSDTVDCEKISNSAVLISNPAILKQFCKEHNIGLVVVSHVSLLSAGLVDEMSAAGVRCFGPTMKAAQLEANKSFAKRFMVKHGIPTAQWKSFINPHEACSFITYADFPALVVKASGLKTGRDIYIASDKDEACRAVQHLTQDWTIGPSTETFIVEERLEGEELYCLGFTDGTTLAPMPLIQLQTDRRSGHLSSDMPTTSTFSVATMFSEAFSRKIQDTVLQQVVDALRQEGCQYKGVLGARIMLTNQGPMVLGFKCSFQEFDSQIIMPLMKSDLYEVIQATMDSCLCKCLPVWTQEKSATAFLLPSAEQVKKGILDQMFPEPIYRENKGHQPSTSLDQDRQGSLDMQVSAQAMRVHTDATPRSDTVLPNLQNHVGCFELDNAQYKNPILVCTTNSIGSKIQIAHVCNKHSAVAKELVAVCMNDLLIHGAQTIFFMPNLACGDLDVGVTEAILDGVAQTCRMARCPLLERQTAQMPDVYPAGNYSLSGCAVGVVERKCKLPRVDEMTKGDLVIGVRSSAVHCSSIPCVRNIMENHSLQYSSLLPVGELLLNPTTNYSNVLLPALQSEHIRACIPITEGGLIGSILRSLPESCGVILDALCWKIPDIFSWLYKEGKLSEQAIAGNFSCGIGAVLIAQKEEAERILAGIHKQQEEAWLIGALIPRLAGSSQVQVRHLLDAMRINTFQLMKNIALCEAPANKIKLAVFIPSAGAKLKLLIDTTRHPGSCARLSLVISNKTAVDELRKAAGAGIPTRVIDHTQFGCQSEFEITLSRVLEEFSIDLICLAGFVRTFSDGFINKWKGKILILYPSLSPSFKMETTKQQAAQISKRVTGCTVCFMHTSASPGPAVLQETITVEVHDSEDSVTERVEEGKQRAVIKAVQLVASGAVCFTEDGNICWSFKE